MCPLRPYKWSIAIVLAIMLGGLLCCACERGFWFGEDSPAEEIAEAYIQKQLGVDVDFTPSSVEKAA